MGAPCITQGAYCNTAADCLEQTVCLLGHAYRQGLVRRQGLGGSITVPLLLLSLDRLDLAVTNR